MTNEAMTRALDAAATIMRLVANGRQLMGDAGFATQVGPNCAERLKHWAGQLETMKDELVNRDAANRTLISTFKSWETIQTQGFGE